MDRNKLTPISAATLAAVLIALLLAPLAHTQPPGNLSSVVSVNNLKNAEFCQDTSVSANTITCTTATGFVGYSAGQTFDVRLANTITGASTLNVNGIGATAIRYNSTLVPSLGLNMLAGGTYRLVYDGTFFQVQGVIILIPATGGSWVGVTGCVVFRSTQDYTVSCDAELVKTPGTLTITNATSPILSLVNSGANQNAYAEWKNAAGRTWLFGTGLPGSSNTGLAYGEYTAGVFQRVIFYLKKGGVVCVGSNNSECTNATLNVADKTVTTGATRVLYELGAADTVDTTIQTNPGGTSNSRYRTATNCASAASPAVCATAASGAFVVAAAGTTVVVNTTAVTANSQIQVTFDSSLGTRLGVTCNATVPALYGVSARTAGTSFTLTATASVTDPACFNYTIVN